MEATNITKVQDILIVSSSDRNVELYPYSTSFTFQFQTMKNVSEVELIGGILPDKSDITKEPYIVLKVNEINHEHVYGTSSLLDNAFSIIQVNSPVTSTYFLNLDMSLSEKLIYKSSSAIPQLSRLSFSLLKSDGSPLTFGTDSVGSIDKMKQILLIFRFTKLVPKSSDYQHNF